MANQVLLLLKLIRHWQQVYWQKDLNRSYTTEAKKSLVALQQLKRAMQQKHNSGTTATYTHPLTMNLFKNIRG